MVGYNLSKPQIFKVMYQKGWKEFIPFMVTVIVILFTDLLIGTLIGLIVAIIIQFYMASLKAVKILEEKDKIILEIDDSASFLNKNRITEILHNIAYPCRIEIYYKGTDLDIIQLLQNQKQILESKNIQCTIYSSTNINFKEYENTQH